MTPSVFAYSSPGGKWNTPLYLNAENGEPIPLGTIDLTDSWQTFRERGSGRTVRLRRADCGLGCRCAAEYEMDEE